jgi:hypothetical protein
VQRSEGVLLRYLNEAYKTLLQTVPEGVRDETFDDLLAFLRATVRAADSSLLDEWEALLDPTATGEEKARRLAAAQAHRELLAARPRDTDMLLRDPRALNARIRTELHKLLLALGRRDFAAAGAGLRTPWTAADLEAGLQPCLTALGSLDITPRARRPDRSVVLPDGVKRFRAQQKLLSPARASNSVEAQALAAGAAASDTEDEWMLDCAVDLSEPRPEDEPLLDLVRIGT